MKINKINTVQSAVCILQSVGKMVQRSPSPFVKITEIHFYENFFHLMDAS